MIVMKTGWSSRLRDRDSYIQPNEDGTVFHFPGFSEESAQWLLDNRDFVALGIDTASLDVGTSTDYMVHQILLNPSVNKYFIENLNLEEVPEGKDVVFVSLPMKVEDAPETPTRVLAILQES